MPIERGYEQVTSPHAGAAMPLASPEDFGAGVAQAAGLLGDTLHRKQVVDYGIEKKQQQNGEIADLSHQFALHRTNMDGIVREMRDGALPGAADHLPRVIAANEAAKEGLLGRAKDPEVRRLFERQWDEYSGKLTSIEDDWQHGQQVGKLVTDNKGLVDTGSSRVYFKPDSWQDELTLAHASIAALHVPPDVRQKLLDYADQEYGGAALASMVRTDPLAAKVQLASGAFDFLGGDKIDHFNKEASIELHSREVAARSAAAAQKALAGDELSNAEQRASAGAEQDPAALAALAAKVAKDPHDAERMKAVIARNDVTRAYRGASVDVVAGDLSKLDTQIAQQGAKADPALTYQRNALAAVLERKRSDAASNPAGVASSLGIVLTPIADFGASPREAIESRISGVEAAAKVNHVPPHYLLPDEARALQATIQTPGIAGKLAALAAARRFGGQRAQVVMQQVAPNDPVMAYLTTLEEPVQRLAIQGRDDARTLNKGEVDPDTKAKRGAIDQRMRAALRTIQGPQRAAIFDTANAIEAHLLAGGAAPSEATRFDAVRLAMGGRIRVGTGQWEGGLGAWNGQAFMLPRGVTAGEFGRAAQLSAMADAKAKGGPVNRDGSPAAITGAHPVAIGPGLYQFETAAGQPLQRRDGKTWTVRIGR